MEIISINDKQDLKKIFEETKTIAIVGLSPKPEKMSNMVGKFLKEKGYKIIPIYPKEERILGEKVYRSISEVDENIDMVNVFRKSEYIPEIVEEILNRDDINTIWLQLGIINNEAMKKAKEKGLNVVQDKCAKVEYNNIFK
ncbi:CoA-binding protein [Methanococcus aeolicus]|uniref:CoA-binding domain protein n=1 Tax=Methanococcus aeolicus (strain ATCC BAA-1280 / DSM 17508 / OCM 812 / Nankai-3) TaxID=419665 RepID=A6UTG6_META3|nr:CoA-binding protein [Methanococcus aeolicus]ABR55788.1 CoA-binding domain protein [Methanococcus aeolicus Nankai-3]UXM84106.1 CoA-binding protein [Methanococcus aeolicus]